MKSLPVSEDAKEVPEPDADQVFDEEDVNSPEWKNKKKHIFILSESGKPIYSRWELAFFRALGTADGKGT